MRFSETKLERLQGKLNKVNNEIQAAQGLRRASLFVRRQELLRQIAKVRQGNIR